MDGSETKGNSTMDLLQRRLLRILHTTARMWGLPHGAKAVMRRCLPPA